MIEPDESQPIAFRLGWYQSECQQLRRKLDRLTEAIKELGDTEPPDDPPYRGTRAQNEAYAAARTDTWAFFERKLKTLGEADRA